MYKILIVLLAFITVTVLLPATISEVAAEEVYYPHMYPAAMIVKAVDRIADELKLQDCNGHVWIVESVEDYEIDDIVACIMHDNYTESVLDDRILVMNYAGYISNTLGGKD